jgi:hypothetical protein
VGASGWSYTVPYQDDIDAALQDLRWQVYRSDDYYKQPDDPSLDLTESEFVATLGSRDSDGIYDFILDEWRISRSLPRPSDPDTLLNFQRDSGTHSIIDIRRVDREPGYYVAAPLADADLVAVFGTTQPSLDQVKTTSSPVLGRGRWHGTYIVAYDNGQPSHIHFFGYSGD